VGAGRAILRCAPPVTGGTRASCVAVGLSRERVYAASSTPIAPSSTPESVGSGQTSARSKALWRSKVFQELRDSDLQSG
jgi:hypothetical protein